MIVVELKVNKPLHEKWNSLISKLEADDLYGKKNLFIVAVTFSRQ